MKTAEQRKAGRACQAAGTDGTRRQRFWKWLSLAVGVALVTAAAGVRIRGALNDLWLDEIGSLELAQQISSPAQVFTSCHYEINHYLNTLWLHFAGSHGNWPGYRIPSLVAGVGAVVLAGLIGRRRNARAGMFALALTGSSYVLILYSSEARGYSTAVFFSLLSFYFLDLHLERGRWPLALGFSLSAVLAMLSHLAAVSLLLAGLAWSVYRLGRMRLGAKSFARRLASCFAAPMILLAALYFVDIRHIVNAGGTASSSLAGSCATALAWAFGTAQPEWMKIPGAILALVVLGTGIGLLWHRKSDCFVFFVGVILVFPVLLVVLRRSDVVYIRYFILSICFLLIMLSYVLGALYDRGPGGRILSCVILMSYLCANGWHIRSLCRYGRGSYGEAVRFMTGRAKQPIVTVGGDQDLRIGLVLQFYAGEAAPGTEVRYCQHGSLPPEGMDWIICHKESFEEPVPQGAQLTDASGNRYKWVRTFRAAPLSGLHWFIYQNSAR